MRGYILHMYRKGAITSDGGFMWLYDQSRGYTPQFVVIRLVVLMMCQQRTRKKSMSGYVFLSVVIYLILWLCVVIRGYMLHVYRKGPRTT